MPFPSRGDLLFPSLFYNHPIAYRMTDRGQKREWNNSGGRFCAKGLSLFVAAEALTFFWLCRAAVLSSPRKRRQGEGSAKEGRSSRGLSYCLPPSSGKRAALVCVSGTETGKWQTSGSSAGSASRPDKGRFRAENHVNLFLTQNVHFNAKIKISPISAAGRRQRAAALARGAAEAGGQDASGWAPLAVFSCGNRAWRL